MTATPLVSIVIPVRNDREGITRTLGAIQQLPNHVQSVLECVVVDGGSTDGTLEVIANFPTLVDHLLSGRQRRVRRTESRNFTSPWSMDLGAWRRRLPLGQWDR